MVFKVKITLPKRAGIISVRSHFRSVVILKAMAFQKVSSLSFLHVYFYWWAFLWFYSPSFSPSKHRKGGKVGEVRLETGSQICTCGCWWTKDPQSFLCLCSMDTNIIIPCLGSSSQIYFWMAFAWDFLSRISISQITGTIGANHLSTERVSKTETSNICIKANTFKKKVKISKSLSKTIELIALKKKKKRHKSKIVVNLQCRNGTNPEIYWDIFAEEFLVLSFQIFALFHSTVFSLVFVKPSSLFMMWSEPQTPGFEVTIPMPMLSGVNWEAQHVNGVRISEAGGSRHFVIWFPKERWLAWLCFVVNFSFKGMNNQKNIILSKLWVVRGVCIKEIPKFCPVCFLPMEKVTCWVHTLFGIGVYMEGVLYKCPKLWKVFCQSLQKPGFSSSNVMALFAFSLCPLPAEKVFTE